MHSVRIKEIGEVQELTQQVLKCSGIRFSSLNLHQNITSALKININISKHFFNVKDNYEIFQNNINPTL